MLPPARALANTAQSFPPSNSVGPGPLIWDIQRGPILPPRGTKERDRILRLFDQHDYNGDWQGARSGVIKKLCGVGWQITGPDEQYYQDILGYAHFGHGWEYLLKMVLRDYLTQSYGGIFEIAGPGDPTEPLIERPTGLNHLDAGRCYVTGNPIYPILYYSLWDGRLHKMHASRVYMMVDDPNPDERYFGIGNCALERAIALVQREIRMGQYIDALLDDRPQPGILSLTGVTENNWNVVVSKYTAQVNNDALPVFGKTIVLTSIDPNAAVKAEVIPFSQTPEKFDYIKYTDLDLTKLALAMGVDRQELAELAGRSLGSGSQSAVLAMKSRAKLYGDVLTGLERFMNWAFLDREHEFKFVEHDAQADITQAGIDLQLVQTATALAALPGISPLEIKKLLVSRSDTFRDAMTDEKGQIIVTNFDPQTPAQALGNEPVLEGDTPAIPASVAPAPPSGQQVTAQQMKAFSATSADFRTRFEDVLNRAADGRLRRNQAENLMLGLLLSSGEKAFADGLNEGGVTEPLDEDDKRAVQNWVSDSIDYLDPLLDAVFGGTLSEAQITQRADMWANKGLASMLAGGRLSADANGMYIFTGTDGVENCPTCKRLKNQVHRFKDWQRKALVPGVDTENFDCGGYNCKHKLKKTIGPAMGDF